MSRDRRRRDIGAAGGDERGRAGAGRRATDGLKMSCPFCGASESLILRSRGLVTADRVGRRRQCASCGKRFPTSERLDREMLERELADDYPVAPAIVGPASVPVTWENVDALLHRLWGQAKDREYVKRDWMALQHVLAELKRSALNRSPLHT